MRTGTRWTILVKLPVAFSGGRTLNCGPGRRRQAADMAGEDLAGQHVGLDPSTGNPGCMRASWLSLKLASIQSPCAGTSEMSWAPTGAKAPARALRLPITPSMGARSSV